MLNETNDEDSTEYKVLVNDEDQYSIWNVSLAVPPGWRDVGTSGSKTECLEYIEKTWTDMRPRSLRQAMSS